MLLPEQVNVSLGTAGVLGLERVKLQEVPTTAHLMVGAPGCTNDCQFCTQAKSLGGKCHGLSRVTWPEHDRARLLSTLGEALDKGTFKRVCIQVVESPRGTSEALQLTGDVRNLSARLPISVCSFPYSSSRVAAFMDKGATNVGLPLDAASPEVYTKVKGGNIQSAWRVLEKCSSLWPGRISTHLIVGLGETEKDLVDCLVRAKQLGITVGLFAFTPVRGTALGSGMPPPVDTYRRVQIAAFALKMGADPGCIELQGDRISRVHLEGEILKLVKEGMSFETSGCPGCNRPYYNERPGGIMMNYPRKLTPEEAAKAVAESGIFIHRAGAAG